MRAALVGGLGLLAVAAVGWALVGAGDEIEPPAQATTPAVAEPAAAEPTTATLVEAPAIDSGAVANPFEADSGAPPPTIDPAPADPAAGEAGPAVAVAPARTPNPFRSIDGATARDRRSGDPPRVAPVAGATAKPASRLAGVAQPTRAVSPRAADREPGLLQTLMDNIQQPVEPPRDTRGMDRLARRLDRAPMPDAGPVVVATAAPARKAEATPASARPATPHGEDAATVPLAAAASAEPAASARARGRATAASATPQHQSLRALLEQCPATNSTQSQRCRRQMCERAGVAVHHCTRH